MERNKDADIRKERLLQVGQRLKTPKAAQDIQAKLDEQKWMRRQQDLARRLSNNQRHAKLRAQKQASDEFLKLQLHEKKTRRWKGILAKISLEPPTASYYDRTPFKPGVYFFIALEQAVATSKVKLQVNIPDMLLCHKHVAWLRTEARMVRAQEDFKVMEFYRLFHPPNTTERTPAAVLRVPSNDGHFKSIALSFAEFADTIQKNQLPSLGILQRYVRFNGTYPAIVRLFYIKQTRDQRATHAWSIFNKTETVSGFYGKHMVDLDGFDTVDVVQLQNGTIEPYIVYAKRVVELLEIRFALRIEEMVLDFLRGEDDLIWLLGCQGFRIDESVLVVKEQRQLLRTSYSASAISQYLQMEHDQRLAEMHCKLCLLPFKSHEITNQLPYKTLLLFKERTMRKKKGPLDLSHLRIVSADYLTHSIRICELCYCLVLAEIELMKAEMMLARVLDVPMEVYDVMNPKVYQHPSYLPGRIHQWRVVVYFKGLETLKKANFDRCFLRYFLFGEWFSRPLPKNWSSSLNFAGLHYFFATKSEVIRETCQSLEVQFEISASASISAPLLQGSVRLFKFFTFHMNDHSGIHQEIQLHMFANDCVAGKLTLVAGLACDREIKIKDLQSTISRFMTFYVPGRSYFSSDQLPEEWMEMFAEGYKPDMSSLVLDSSEEVKHMYTPVLPFRYFTPSNKRSIRTLTPSASCKQTQSLRPASSHISKAKLTLRSQGSTVSTKYDDFVSPMIQSPRVPSAGITRGISPILEHQVDESVDDWGVVNFPTEREQNMEVELADVIANPVEQFLKGKPAERYTDQLRRIVKPPLMPLEPELLVLDGDASLLPTMTTIELLPRPSSGSLRPVRVSSAHRLDAKHRLMRQTYSLAKPY